MPVPGRHLALIRPSAASETRRTHICFSAWGGLCCRLTIGGVRADYCQRPPVGLRRSAGLWGALTWLGLGLAFESFALTRASGNYKGFWRRVAVLPLGCYLQREASAPWKCDTPMYALPCLSGRGCLGHLCLSDSEALYVIERELRGWLVSLLCGCYLWRKINRKAHKKFSCLCYFQVTTAVTHQTPLIFFSWCGYNEMAGVWPVLSLLFCVVCFACLHLHAIHIDKENKYLVPGIRGIPVEVQEGGSNKMALLR